MEFEYQRCTVHITAGIDHDAIVAHVRIDIAPGSVSSDGDTHDMELHRDFLDENEAVAFAQERAIAWIDEHVEPAATGVSGAGPG